MSQLDEIKSSEFKEGQSLLSEPASRRQFIKGLGATLAVAGLSSCGSIRKPKQTILPYAKKPEGLVEGQATFYASATHTGDVVEGILVETYEGRPTKIEGNPDHPISLGATSMYTQADLYNLYNPDRLQQPLHNKKPVSKPDFETWARDLNLTASSKIGILIDRKPSLVFHQLLNSFKAKYPKTIIAEHNAHSKTNSDAGIRLLSGQSLRPEHDFEKADVVVSIDADFLNGAFYGSNNAKGFSKRRDVEKSKQLNRLYVVEDHYSSTGGSADHRIKLSHQYMDAFLAILTHRLIQKDTQRAKLFFTSAYIREVKAIAAQHESIVDDVYVSAIADDLLKHPKASIVVVGDNQPAHVHAMGALLNLLLGNINNTVTYHARVVPDYSHNLDNLTAAAKSGDLDLMVVLSDNPSYTLSGSDFSKAFESLDNTVYLGLFNNDTAHASEWVLPKSHAFESWGDLITQTGTQSVTQPTLEPMYDSYSDIDLLLTLLGRKTSSADYVKKTLLNRRNVTTWTKWLHTGIIQTTSTRVTKPFSTQALASSLSSLSGSKPSFVATFQVDNGVYDGRFANNAWLQELPNPITKIVWDTTAIVSPKTAHSLGLKTGQVAEVVADGRMIKTVVTILPGKADESIALFYGYGQKNAGKLGSNRGYDVYPLQTLDFKDAIPVSLRPVNEFYELVQTQEEGTQHGRPLYRETDSKTYDAKPDVIQHMVEHPKLESLWEEHKFDDSLSKYQWGMTIDLNKCTGCNACAVACQVENNIPTVGKTEVKNGREMHWLRMDRYFEGDKENPEMKNQPMMCVHCELAPCEQVCPVAATVHNEEGLNVMVYNRCVGTRYCSNNCPYKVRRFNFFDWAQRSPHSEKKDRNHLFDYMRTSPEPLKMQKNPEVSVRMRGVMEKCTYCLQRINEGKRRAANDDDRMVKDGEIKTACQQVCSSEAIVFGNISDEKSAVSKTRQTKRAYAVLQELNTKPRTLYLARIKNPHPLIQKKFNAVHTTDSHTDDGHH